MPRLASACGRAAAGPRLAILASVLSASARALAPAADLDSLALLQTRTDRSEITGPNVQADTYRQQMVNFGDAQYVTYMTLGRQIIAGILDTGSFELVVFGADCRTCGVAAHYNSQLSRTFSEGLLQTEQNYGSGRLMSTVARDQLVIGPYTVPQQAFWNVKYAQMPVLFNAAFEAIIGLGPPETPMADAWDIADGLVANVTSYFDRGMQAPEDATAEAKARVSVASELSKNMPPLHSLNCTMFSICMGSAPGADGVFVWRDMTPIRRPELFRRVPVLGGHTWSTNLSLPRLMSRSGSEATAVKGCEDGCSALIDSGTSLLAVPGPVMDSLAERMNLLDENCSNLEVMPDLVFELGGVQVSLPPDSFVAQVVGDKPQYLQVLVPQLNQTRPQRKCQLMLMESNANSTSGPLWILGMPFFRRYYTTFNVGAKKSERSLFIAPHGDGDECTPDAGRTGDQASQPQLRHISAEKIRLPQTAQAAASSTFVRL